MCVLRCTKNHEAAEASDHPGVRAGTVIMYLARPPQRVLPSTTNPRRSPDSNNCTQRRDRDRFTLRYVAEDRAVAGRDLLGHETKPSGEVAAFGECFPSADRGHHGAGDDRTNAGNTHQTPASSVLPRHGCDLIGQVIDPRIEPAPVLSQTLDEGQSCGTTAHRMACPECAATRHAGIVDPAALQRRAREGRHGFG